MKDKTVVITGGTSGIGDIAAERLVQMGARIVLIARSKSRGNEIVAICVWADTAYRSAANEEFMERNGFVSHVHRKRPKGRPMPEAIRRANNAKSKIRSRVEHVFAEQKDRMGLFIRTIGIARAKTKIGLANLVYNIKRLLFLRRIAAA